jgi:two-component system, NarL family, sensor histidine kinase DegS
MHVNFEAGTRQKPHQFTRLGTWYVLALSAIAIVAILGQVFIQLHLRDQLNDSERVNIAGRQRMLSQKITKLALVISSNVDNDSIRATNSAELNSALTLWLQSHDQLASEGNSAEVSALFNDLQKYFQSIHSSATLIGAGQVTGNNLRTILLNEPKFLVGMDLIVNQYALEAQEKVESLSTLEYILFGITLLVILAEIIWIFRPTTIAVSATVSKLIASEDNAHKLAKEIGALYTSLEKSYEQIAIVNKPLDNPVLFAKSDVDGNIVYQSDNMERLFGMNYLEQPSRLFELFPSMKNAETWMKDLLGKVRDGNAWEGEVSFTDHSGAERWAKIGITPVFNNDEIGELVMTGSDTTEHKHAERRMTTKNRAEIEKTINQQKFRSVLILEGQEEERKRIAMDIHDGIGQMLTSLKYQFQSIDLNDRDKAEKRIREIDHLIKDIIREVRRVTFNIKPTVLGDYGIQAALNVFISEIGKLTDIELFYETEGEIARLPQKIEDNIFRIIQEGLNNAIKYSGAESISVSLRQHDGVIVVSVKDEGRGFDTSILQERSANIESGRGFFNMYERTEYINGKLEIQSAEGKGTTVLLTIPLHNSPLLEPKKES